MHIEVRDLRNRMSQVIDAVRAGERIVLTVHGESVADIMPHARRSRWMSGADLRRQLEGRSADAALDDDLNRLAGQRLDDQ